MVSLGVSGVFLKKYNFSKAGALLIPSVPGYFKDDKLNSYGHMCLRNYVENYVCKSNLNDEASAASSSSSNSKEKSQKSKDSHHSLSTNVYFQVSSVGSLNQPWIDEFSQNIHTKKFSLLFPSFE